MGIAHAEERAELLAATPLRTKELPVPPVPTAGERAEAHPEDRRAARVHGTEPAALTDTQLDKLVAALEAAATATFAVRLRRRGARWLTSPRRSTRSSSAISG